MSDGGMSVHHGSNIPNGQGFHTMCWEHLESDEDFLRWADSLFVDSDPDSANEGSLFGARTTEQPVQARRCTEAAEQPLACTEQTESTESTDMLLRPCAGCRKVRMRCDRKGPSCGRCTRLSIPCAPAEKKQRGRPKVSHLMTLSRRRSVPEGNARGVVFTALSLWGAPHDPSRDHHHSMLITYHGGASGLAWPTKTIDKRPASHASLTSPVTSSVSPTKAHAGPTHGTIDIRGV